MENIDIQAVELALLAKNRFSKCTVETFIAALRQQITKKSKEIEALTVPLSYGDIRNIFKRVLFGTLFGSSEWTYRYMNGSERSRIYETLLHEHTFTDFLIKKSESSTVKQPEVPQKSESSKGKEPEVPQKSESSTVKQVEKKPQLYTDAELEGFGSRVQKARESRLKREFEHIVNVSLTECLFESNIVMFSHDGSPYSQKPSLVKALLSYDFGDFDLKSLENGIMVSFKK